MNVEHRTSNIEHRIRNPFILKTYQCESTIRNYLDHHSTFMFD